MLVNLQLNKTVMENINIPNAREDFAIPRWKEYYDLDRFKTNKYYRVLVLLFSVYDYHTTNTKRDVFLLFHLSDENIFLNSFGCP
jgi:hypothetical protein